MKATKNEMLSVFCGIIGGMSGASAARSTDLSMGKTILVAVIVAAVTSLVAYPIMSLVYSAFNKKDK